MQTPQNCTLVELEQLNVTSYFLPVITTVKITVLPIIHAAKKIDEYSVLMQPCLFSSCEYGSNKEQVE